MDTPSPNCKWIMGNCNVTCGQGYKELKLISAEAEELGEDEKEKEDQLQDNTKSCDSYPSTTIPCDTGISCNEGKNIIKYLGIILNFNLDFSVLFFHYSQVCK